MFVLAPALAPAVGDLAQPATTPKSGLRGAVVPFILLALVALLAVGLAVWLMPAGSVPGLTNLTASRDKPAANGVAGAPQVQPVTLLPVTQDDARTINAAVPMIAGPVVPAAPFRYVGTPENLERATTCLAAAVLYEAGDDAVGERAVAQVVLNRLRHPVFPKSVCGVVFEGSTRATGCQFTFTCDGALARVPPRAAWLRARAVAAAGLAGGVDPTVGLATHYHTDWVVPYWSSSLDKIAKIDTHLFFRWRGWWGTRRAFSGSLAGGEALPAQIAALSDAPATLAVDAASVGATDVAVGAQPAAAGGATAQTANAKDLNGSTLRLSDPATDTYVLHLAPGAFSGEYALAALSLCEGKRDCSVYGYLRPDKIPQALPLPRGAAATASFYYQASAGRAYWDCRTLPRTRPAECQPGTAPDVAMTGE